MTQTIQTRLPFRAGSIQKRGGVYWAIFSNQTGKLVQANTRTDDPKEALRRCAQASALVMRYKLAMVEAIANGQDEEKGTWGDSLRAALADPGDGSATRDSRPRANRKKPARAAGTGGNDPRQKSTRKGGQA